MLSGDVIDGALTTGCSAVWTEGPVVSASIVRKNGKDISYE